MIQWYSVEFKETKETSVHEHGEGIILISMAGFMDNFGAGPSC